MKKWFCAALALAILLTSAALADTEIFPMTVIGEATEVNLEIDNEAVVEPLEDSTEEIFCVSVTKKDAAPVVIAIAPDEMMEGRSIEDFDDAGIAELEAYLGEPYEDPQFNVETTPNGVKFIAVWDVDDPAYLLVTVYQGNCIELIQFHEDLSPITDADVAFCKEVMNGIRLDPVETVQPEN